MTEDVIAFEEKENLTRQIHFKDYGKNLRSKSAEAIWQELMDDDATEKDKEVIESILGRGNPSIVKPIEGEIGEFDDGDSIEINLLWKDKKIMFFMDDYYEEYLKAKKTDYQCYSVTEGFNVDEFLKSIAK